MVKISTLFWDVGGVLLTNGWDHELRRRAAEKFGLDWEEFESLHKPLARDFETGRLSLDDYLQQTVFHATRKFTADEFKTFMFEASGPLPGLEILKQLAASGRYLLGMLNNESLELNEHRLTKFQLRQYFSVFCSSCFVGYWKPEPEIFRLAVNVTQREPSECVFIDDRPANVAAARGLSMQGIVYQSPEQLMSELRTSFSIEGI